MTAISISAFWVGVGKPLPFNLVVEFVLQVYDELFEVEAFVFCEDKIGVAECGDEHANCNYAGFGIEVYFHFISPRG